MCAVLSLFVCCAGAHRSLYLSIRRRRQVWIRDRASTLAGLTPFTEAYRLLGVRRSATFDETARELGVTQ